MPRPVHFEIHADDPQRAAAFYRDVFGWQISRWGEQDYWVVITGEEGRPGINGGLLPRQGPRPSVDAPVNGFVCTLDVDDLDQAVKRVEAAGGDIALPRMPVPGMGWLSYVHDTEGNLLGLMQEDASAS